MGKWEIGTKPVVAGGRVRRSGPICLSRTLDRPTSCCSTAWVSERECAISTSHVALDSLPILRPRGMQVSGLDAAEALVAIARVRTPTGDFRVGDMFELPFADSSFDVGTSFNGIWKGCEGALSEARRVLVPDGRLGLTFWGRANRMGLMPYFAKMIELSPPGHGSASMEQGDTGRRGVMEDMLAATGFELIERGTVDVVNEWPDVGTAVRALAAAGPCVPAIEAVGYEAFCDALREVISPLWDREVGVRITSEFGWITAKSA